MNSSDETVEAAVRAILAMPGALFTDDCHADHIQSAGCPVCKGDVPAMVREAYPIIAAAVRAEAVAEIRAAKDEQARAFGHDPGAYFAGRVDGLEDAARVVAAGSVPVATPEPTLVACPCWKCDEERRTAKYALDGDQMAYLSRFMIVCPECGNKRCPKATSHEFECTGSNESGQRGSRYGRVATPPAEPAARVTRESIQRVADAILAEPFRPAPSQPVTCEHDWADGPHGYTTTQDIDRGVPSRWCPGPVSVPKESSDA